MSPSAPAPDVTPRWAASDDDALLAALRAGDEAAFLTLVQRHQAALLRLALTYVHNRAVAEEVVQETWVGVLKSLEHFEAYASLKTWIFRILINRAISAAQREGRAIPFSTAFAATMEDDGPSVPPERFQSTHTASAPKGWWAAPPTAWGAPPEQLLVAGETRAYIAAAIAALPPAQREVMTLRDALGCTSDEVCELLGITEGNQRVLLHRARSKVRLALEQYVHEEVL